MKELRVYKIGGGRMFNDCFEIKGIGGFPTKSIFVSGEELKQIIKQGEKLLKIAKPKSN